MNNIDQWPAMTAMARILTLKDETKNFTVCDDFTRISIHENDVVLLQKFCQLVHPKHAAEAKRAAAFIAGIYADKAEAEAAFNRMMERQQKIDEVMANYLKSTTL